MRIDMEAMYSMKPERIEQLSALHKELKRKTQGTLRRDWFANYHREQSSYEYGFYGDITDKLIELLGHEPTPEEIILLVDDGFSHFGANCSISGRQFRGHVNID